MSCVGLGPRASSTPMWGSSGNFVHWGGSERRHGSMTTSMTWVRGPRSTFKLPIFEETHNRALTTASVALQKFRASRCPLWVISGHRRTSSQCPLYPQKRTLELGREMSALCQKQTSDRSLLYVVMVLRLGFGTIAPEH